MSYLNHLPLFLFCAILTVLVIGYSSFTKFSLLVSICHVEASSGLEPPLDVVWLPAQFFKARSEQKNLFWTTPVTTAIHQNPNCWHLPARLGLAWFWKRMFDNAYDDWGVKLIAKLDPHARILAMQQISSLKEDKTLFQVENVSKGLWLANAPNHDAEVSSQLFQRLDHNEKDLRLPASVAISTSLRAPTLRAQDLERPQGAWIQFSHGKIEFQARLYGGAPVSTDCRFVGVLYCGKLQPTQTPFPESENEEKTFQKNCQSMKIDNPSDLENVGLQACLFDQIVPLLEDCPDKDSTKLQTLLNDILMIPPETLPGNFIPAAIECLGQADMPKSAQLWTDAIKTGIEFHHSFSNHKTIKK